MQVLIGTDDGSSHLRPLEQLYMTLRNEIRIDPGAHLAGTVRVLFGKTDPFDCGMAGRYLAAEQAHAAASDDRKADTPGRLFHWFTPARIFCLNSAIAEIV